MNYIVTARKWRPDRFENVIGQEHITTTIKNAIKNKRIAHAYLFAGPRGVGKTTTARILAKTLNCLSPVDFEPCNKCDMCNLFNSSQSLDIIEIDGASNRRIEEIRTLRESVKYAPTKGLYKVYIIDEVHMLTNESFNALLKTLEEPPEHTIFIFATTDVHKVPLTIISRCQRFDFRRIELIQIKSLIKKIAASEKIEIDDQSLTIIAKKADGALRDAESIFDQLVSFCGNKIEAAVVSEMMNLINEDIYFDISDAVIDKKFISAFEISKLIYDNGWNFIDFLNGLIEHFRNIMTIVISGKANLIESADVYKEKYILYKNKFSEGDLLRILQFLNKTQQELRFTQNHKLKIEIMLCHLIGLERSASISEIIDSLQEIKKKAPIKVKETSDIQYKPSILSKNEKDQPVIIKTGFNFKTNYSNLSNNSEITSLEQSDTVNFDSVIQKWSHFVKEVNQEKMFVGSALSGLQLLGLDGNNLNVQINDYSNKKILIQNKDYFISKTNEVFGKKLIFSFSEDMESETNSDGTEIKTNNNSDEENPLIKAIINDLSGEEISK